MTPKEFQNLTQQGILLLDGATGSNLKKEGMPTGICTEQWVLEHPDVLADLQHRYVEAGSRIVYAPTFAANRISLAMHGLEDRVQQMNKELVEISKKAADGKAYVAGDVTTTGKMLEPRGTLQYQELLDAYKEQITALAEAGADLIVAETMMAVDETIAVLEAASSVCSLPVMCSMTIESDGSLFFGGTVTEAVEALQEMGAAAVGINCSVGPDQLEAVVRSISQTVTIPVIAKPNAGMPSIDAHGIAHYSMGPGEFAVSMKKLIESGARIVGGCCGTTPEYIRELAGLL